MNWDLLYIVSEFRKVIPKIDVTKAVQDLEKLEREIDFPPSVSHMEGQELVDFFQENYSFFDDFEFQTSGIDKGLLTDVLSFINEELRKEGIQGVIHVYGGCAMMLLGVDTRRSWDFDFIFEGKPTQTLISVLRKVEDRFDFPHGTFDKTMGPLIATHFKQNHTVIKDTLSNLMIRVCSAEQMLAMKLYAARMEVKYQDFSDALFLCKELNISTKDDMYNILYMYIKEDSIIKENSRPERLNRTDVFMTELEVQLNE